MEIKNIELEHSLILIMDNQKIKITPFLTSEPGNIKLGIEAPFGISVNREEIHKLKQKKMVESSDTVYIDFPKKVQALFTELLLVTNKSEKLEVAAKQLFNKDKILTPNTIQKIACGDMTTSKWIITCAIDVLINAQPKKIKTLFTLDELFIFWARPLLNRKNYNQAILTKAAIIDMPQLLEKIINYSKATN